MSKDKVIRIPPGVSESAVRALIDRLANYRKERLTDSLIARKVQTIYVPGSLLDEVEEIFDRDLNPV